jgi:uncharacterized protein (TIGR02246 family)
VMSEDEARIRSLIDVWARALKRKDLDLLMSTYCPDVLFFDVVNPLEYAGAQGVRRRAEEWFRDFKGSIGYEVRDLSVATGGDIAFSRHLFRVSGTLQDGGQIQMWVRNTTGYRKVDGAWKVSHTHNSVPFDTTTGMASLDLEPQA